MNAEYEEALGVYENLLKINGMNAQALINAGSIQFYFGNMNAAINYYSRACEIETNNYTIYLNLGNAYAELRQFDEAMHNYNRAMKIDPKNPGLYSAIALLYQDAKDYVTANLYYDKAIALKPDPETYLSKATVLMSMLVYKEAVNVLMKAIALDDKFLKGYITLANCYSSMKDFDNADKIF